MLALLRSSSEAQWYSKMMAKSIGLSPELSNYLLSMLSITIDRENAEKGVM